MILKEVTAAEAGLTKEQQYELIFKAILDKGVLTTEEIYSVINAELQKNAQALSTQGKATLRALINNKAVNEAYIYPHDRENPGWRLTPEGRELVSSESTQQEIVFNTVTQEEETFISNTV